MLVQKGTFH